MKKKLKDFGVAFLAFVVFVVAIPCIAIGIGISIGVDIYKYSRLDKEIQRVFKEK